MVKKVRLKMIRFILILISVVFLALYLGNAFKGPNQTANSTTSTAIQKKHTNKGEWDRIKGVVQIKLKEFLF